MSDKVKQYVEKIQNYIRHRAIFPSILPRLNIEIEIKGASAIFQHVQLDGSIVKNLDNTSTSTKSLSITVGNNPNRALVVVVSLAFPISQGGITTSVTGAANAFTRMAEASTSTNQGADCAMFISLNPNTGNNTITAHLSNISSGDDVLMAIYSLYNVDQKTGYYNNNVIQVNDAGANPSSSVTPNSINSFFIDFLVGGSSPSSETQTLAFSVTGIYAGHQSQYKSGPLANLNPITFGWTIAGNSGHDVVEIKSVLAGSISESISITDMITKIATHNIPITDPFTISETINKLLSPKNISDTISTIDTLTLSEIFYEVRVDSTSSNTSSVSSGSPTSTLNITIGNNQNRLLVVCIQSVGPSSIASISIIQLGGGQSLQQAGSAQIVAGNIYSSIWYLINPPTGAQTITITYTGISVQNAFVVQGAYSLYNVEQSTGINVNNISTQFATTGNPSNTINVLRNNSAILDSVAEVATSIMTNPDVTKSYSLENTSMCGASQYNILVIPGNNVLSWTAGASGTYYVSVAIEVFSASKLQNISDTISMSDILSRNIPISDQFSIAEKKFLSLIKSISDNPSVSDSVTNVITKIVTGDTTPFSDALTHIIKKSINESTIQITDSISKSFVKSITDNLSMSETNTNKLVKLLVDDPTIAESTLKELVKIIVDQISITSITKTPIFRNILDNISVGDSPTKAVTKSIIDNIPILENVSRSLSKSLSDVIPMSDIRAIPFTRQLLDTESILDKMNRSILKPILDSIIVQEIVTAFSPTATIRKNRKSVKVYGRFKGPYTVRSNS